MTCRVGGNVSVALPRTVSGEGAGSYRCNRG